MAHLPKATILQRRVGDLGTVQPYRPVPDRGHEAPGWWATPALALDGCECRFCTASASGRDAYLGWDLPGAAAAVEVAVIAHAAADPARIEVSARTTADTSRRRPRGTPHAA